MCAIGKIIPRVMAATLLLLTVAAHAAAQGDADDEGARCESALGPDRQGCAGERRATNNVAAILHPLGQPARPGEFRLPLSQIGEDLRFLRAAARHLSHAASQSGELDLKAVAKTASEVRKRANRLRDSLELPDSKEGRARGRETAPLEPERLRTALAALSALLSDAARNPVLRGYLIDPTRSVAARGGLDEIVELSERIKQSSETLVKPRR